MDKKLFNQLTEIIPSVDFKNQLKMNDLEAARVVVSCIYDETDPFLNEFTLFDEIYYGLQNNDIDNLITLLETSKILFMLDLIITILDYLATDLKNLSKESRKAREDLYLQSRFFLSYLDNLDENFAIKTIKEMQKLLACSNEKAEIVGEMVINSLSSNHELLSGCIEELIHNNEITYHDLMLGIIKGDLKPLVEQFQLVEFLRRKYSEVTYPDVLKLQHKINIYESIGLDD